MRVQRFVDVATARRRRHPLGLLVPLPAPRGLGRQRHPRRRRAARRRFQRVRTAAGGPRSTSCGRPPRPRRSRPSCPRRPLRRRPRLRPLPCPLRLRPRSRRRRPPPPRPEPPPAPSPALPPTVHADRAAAAAVYALTNELRAENGLPPLAHNSALDRPPMATPRRWPRTTGSPTKGRTAPRSGPAPRPPATAAGHTYRRTCTAASTATRRRGIVQAWADSPGHYSNMLGQQITEIGVGCYVNGDLRWCVQDFGDR